MTYTARHQLWVHWMRLDAPGRCPSQAQLDSFDRAVTNGDGKVRKQILLDVPRTFPTLLKESDRKRLTQVLSWYAGYKREVGYCQSMNYIAAIFVVMGFDDRRCFAAFRAIVDDFCSRYHGKGLEGYRFSNYDIK